MNKSAKVKFKFSQKLNQKGIIPLVIVIGALVLATAGYVGVKSGIIPFIAAPSSPGQIIGPFTRPPNTPQPSATTDPDVVDIQNQNSAVDPDTLQATLAPQVATAIEDEWKTYSSSEYGYTVSYPVDWDLFDGNTETSRQMIIKQNSGLGYVNIQAFFDKSLTEPGNLQVAINALEQRLRGDSSLKVNSFESGIEGEIGGHVATGEQTLRGEEYYFQSNSLLATNGKILLFHSAYKKSAPSDYGQKINRIIKSFSTD